MTIETVDQAVLAEKRKAAMAKAREAKAKKKALEFNSEDSADLSKRRAELLAELATLPDPAPVIRAGDEPGTIVKDGFGPDKVPWTPARLREACNKNEVINGVQFGWVNVIGDPRFPTLSWNGIVYWFFSGKENKIPNVHYYVYKQALEDAQREQEKWAQPANQPVFDGYMSPPHQFSTAGPLEPREG